MKILVINGPNLNLLKERNKDIYGSLSLDDIEERLKRAYPGHTFEFQQSNHEGEIIDKIQSAPAYFDGLIINPGGFAHTSVAIRDSLELCRLPKIEVHLSNLSSRENFRQNLITASVCDGYLSGFREKGYLAAVYLLEQIKMAGN